MKTDLHLAANRGHVKFDWLDTYHYFSFGQYNNPARVHFGALRVINDDHIDAGMGFGMHPHDNMEIVTIPLEGDLHHNDSTGRDEIIRANDVQIMSAGSGIYHSEYNANNDKPVKLFQIWVFPKEKNIKPRYEQQTYNALDRVNKFQTVVAPDDDNAVWINQDAWFSLGDFDANQTQSYNLHKSDSGVYLIVVDGKVKIGEQELNIRDAIAITETTSFEFTATAKTSLLVIEVPMKW